MPLTKLFNLSFSLGEVSLAWNRANVTPVFKDNANENVENYRSISLLSILSKCQERIIHCAIYSHVSPFLTDWQHGVPVQLSWSSLTICGAKRWMPVSRLMPCFWTLLRRSIA